MSIRKAFLLLVSTTLFFTILGGVVGLILGKYLPNYYKYIFRDGDDTEFDPLAVGVGQGLTQGITAGAIIAVILLVVMVWHDVRTGDRGNNKRT